jgi:UDP-N-acetylmuramoyl-L-alanyl-D-glutamate--2,6-diaminopimelate ligase
MAFLSNLQTLLRAFHIDAPDRNIRQLQIDSRYIQEGDVFIACIGSQHDGRDFIDKALSAGASSIIRQTSNPHHHGVITYVQNNCDRKNDQVENSMDHDGTPIVDFYSLPQQISKIADVFYGSPSSKLNIVGVTGTNGKSTTTHLIAQLTNLTGNTGAIIGTLGAGKLEHCVETQNTTPDPVIVQRYLADFVDSDVNIAAVEVSSHGLVQSRLSGVKMPVAVFTNLTRDHLDYHGSMNNYAKAKRLFLEQPGLQFAVLNMHDPEYENWLAAMPTHAQSVLFGQQIPTQTGQLYCCAQQIKFSANGFSFQLKSSWGEANIQVPLLGAFNVSNLLAALASLLVLEVKLDVLLNNIERLTNVAGRMELFVDEQKSVGIMVDYAHTPDALYMALKSARLHCKGDLWCVFGCGGDRDKGKRSEMGRISESFADQIILTNDNPRTESQDEIVRDILNGFDQPKEVKVVLDRKKAIALAYNNSKKNDLILVAGKGHETFQVINEKKLQYDERQFIQRLVEGNAK